MSSRVIKIHRRLRRRAGLKARIRGTSERPRLTVFRSLNNIYAQVIDDERGVTLCAASTRSRDLREQMKDGGNIAAAKFVGAAIAEQAMKAGIRAVCFDRNGYKYHGRVRGLAEAAREKGLVF